LKNVVGEGIMNKISTGFIIGLLCLSAFSVLPINYTHASDLSRSLVNFTLSADGIPVVRIQPENVTVKKGAVFSVNVMIENIPADPGMYGVQFVIIWNRTILSALNMTDVIYHEVTPPSEWDNIWAIKCEINNTGGYVLYAYTWQDGNRAEDEGYCPIFGNHTMATIMFKAIEAGSTALHFDLLDAGTVIGGGMAQPLISKTRSNALLPSLLLDGNVTVSSTLAEDLNGDGVIDLFDALLLAQHFGSKQGDFNWDSNMDLNGDAKVDIFDVVILAHSFGEHA
jgi:hypothetical protein